MDCVNFCCFQWRRARAKTTYLQHFGASFHLTAQTTNLCSTVAGEKRPLDLKEEELKENVTALQVQLSTAREELNNLKQQDKEFVSLSST